MMEARKPKYPYYVLMICVILGLLFIADTFFHDMIPHPVVSSTAAKKATHQKAKEAASVVATSVESQEQVVEETPETQPMAAELTSDSGIEDYFTNLLSKNLGKKTRNDIVVRYYRHVPDGNKIDELRKYGLYIHERPVEGELEEYESNSIYYGDSVNQEDIHLIAYIMLRQGLPIKRIQPSLYHDDWKANSVEIGTDTAANDDPVMTLTEIRNFSN